MDPFGASSRTRFLSVGILLVSGLTAAWGQTSPEVKLGIVGREGTERVVEWALRTINPGARVKIIPVFSRRPDIADAGCRALEAGVAGVLGRGSRGWTPGGRTLHFRLDSAPLAALEPLTLSLFPDGGFLPEAVKELVARAGWRNFTVVCDSEEDPVLRELLEEPDFSVEAVVFPAGASDDWIREAITERRLVVTGATGSVALGLVDRLLEVAVDSPTHYDFLLGALLPQAPLYFPGRLKGTLTALRLRPAPEALFRRFRAHLNLPLSAEAAFTFDTVKLISAALDAVHDTQLLESIAPLNCKSDQRWLQGPTFFNVCTGIKFEGLSGRVELGIDGRRQRLQVETVRIGPRGIPLLPLSVAVLPSRPYVTRRNNHEGETYEGFGVDLMREISKLAGFEFDLVPVRENGYGSYNRTTREWTGAIGELVRREVDMVLGDLVVNPEREAVVDFSVPFMQYGIGALYYRERHDVDLFFFLSPFSAGVWFCISASVFSFSTVLFFFGRKKSASASSSSLWGDWWWGLVGWIWWTGVVLLAASYTAALLALLRSREGAIETEPLSSPRDLLESSSTRVEYGTLSRGSTAAFFRDSERADYRRMWEKMEETSRGLDSLEEGAARVVAARGRFAFLGETPALELLAAGCGSGSGTRLRLLPGIFPLSSAGYAVALTKDSEYTKPINEAILKLRDTGVIQRLKTKWWSKVYDDSDCEDVPRVPGLGLPELGGLFIFLFAVLGLAVLFGVFSVLCLKAK